MKKKRKEEVHRTFPLLYRYTVCVTMAEDVGDLEAALSDTFVSSNTSRRAAERYASGERKRETER